MKKLLIVFAAGALLASCGSSTEDKAAATAFCDCYTMNDAADATSLTEIMESAEKMTTCIKTWQSDFEGKISKDGFSEELKESCPDAHSKAEEMGMFK